MSRKYVVGSGWYCAPNRSWPNGGNRYSRTVEFHELWKQALLRTCQPSAIVIVDSASPIPLPPDPIERVLSLDANYQHTDYQLTGWGRSFILGAVYAYACMADFIYVEQDCLVFGDWLDQCYAASSKNPNRFLVGMPLVQLGVPMQILEMSLVFVPRAVILDLVRAFPNGPTDRGRDEPQLGRCGVPFGFLPFGVGRSRPFTLDGAALEVQHWTDEEVQRAADYLGVGEQVRQDFQRPETWRG